ncbi:hypothetical protein LBUCD034_0304 [Lentilactobacillus buchneri subsp. silagei CD034]|uniref:Uncharacterized protein n=1 Tax=Lentilactobacillus buchneri subsp. silagei CD034 TaxID=1071400 RepID=J9W334_LENBU|nr:hypothetical protein LBUCD034_0304 [Lentilactobacillus buchneri subsp. silagei CD034]
MRDGHAKYQWRRVYSTTKKEKGTIDVSRKVSNGMTGSVGMSKKAIGMKLGFNVSKSTTVTVHIPYKTSGKGREVVEYTVRKIRYKITRTKTITTGINGYVTSRKKLVAYVYKYDGIIGRVVKD